MATVTGLTATRMEAIEAASIVDGEIDINGHLILTRFDTTTIDAGYALVAIPDNSIVTYIDIDDYPETDLPSSYPMGFSLTWVTATEATAGGWDFGGMDGTLLTVQALAASAYQMWTRSGASSVEYEYWMRQGTNSGGWSAWSKFYALNNLPSTQQIVWAGDTNLYRSAANTLKTDDALIVVGDVTAAKGRFGGGSGDAVFIGDDGKLVDVNIADAVGIQGQQNAANAVLVFGSAKDTNLYRNGVGQLKTDGIIVADNTLYVARQTIGADTATVTFSSIPSNLRDITLKVSARMASGGAVAMYLRINGASGASDYAWSYAQCNPGTGAYNSAHDDADGQAVCGVINDTTGRWSNATIQITGWDNPHSGDVAFTYVSHSYLAVGANFVTWGGGIYKTSAAYTSISLFLNGGISFKTGSDFLLTGTYPA